MATTKSGIIYPRSLPRFDYLDSKTVEEACRLLSKYEGRAKAIAGGTDLLISLKRRMIAPQYIINLKSIRALDYIDYSEGEGLRIGALTTLTDIENSPMVRERLPILADAARQIGQPQIRNWATIGGNLCNAAPSADMAPPLIGLGAKVKIAGVNGERVLPLQAFFVGPGINALQTGEILTEIQVPTPAPHTQAVYLKLPARALIDIAIVSIAVVLLLDQRQRIAMDIRIVLGAVAPTPMRAHKAEEIIKGKVIQEELIEKAAQTAAEEAKPISDVRGSANYRKEMVKVLAKRAMEQVSGSTD